MSALEHAKAETAHQDRAEWRTERHHVELLAAIIVCGHIAGRDKPGEPIRSALCAAREIIRQDRGVHDD